MLKLKKNYTKYAYFNVCFCFLRATDIQPSFYRKIFNKLTKCVYCLS